MGEEDGKMICRLDKKGFINHRIQISRVVFWTLLILILFRK